MTVLNYIDIIAALAGLAVAILLCAFPRFGSASWLMVLMVLSACAASAVQGFAPVLHWGAEDEVFLAFACLLVCITGGSVASYSLERVDFRTDFKSNRLFFLIVCTAAPVLVGSLYFFRPVTDPSTDIVALGPGGYAGAVYLLLGSVVGLANVEQTLRSAEEHIRWEIKFLLLAIASIFATVIYIASQVLLYPPEYAILPVQAMRVFPVIFLCASGLIFHSWRRCTGRGRVTVSHGIVYSTITLLSVGVYLAATGFLARLLSDWSRSEVPLGPIVFLLSGVALTAILLGTAFRHRARRWIRNNVFAGRYDYRQLWMDATEKVRAIDSTHATAAALAHLIHNALGAIDITVWLRSRDGQNLSLAFARGMASGAFDSNDTFSVQDVPTDFTEPVSVGELLRDSSRKWPKELLAQAKAALVVPLVSADRLVGLLTVGADRSGRTFDAESREFLRVLAVHAASEFHKAELLENLVQIREAEAFRTFSTFLLHDLKNFASTLSLIAKNAVRHHSNPDFQLDAFQSVLETAEKMKRLCNGLRTFSTNLAANKRSDDVNEIAAEVVKEFQSSLSPRLTVNLSPLPRTQIDRQEFSRVLHNLIGNANEASSDGPIELSTYEESNSIVVCVRDRGKGIPKEFLENELFQPFHTTKGDGLGIGLFQCKKIVEAHEGTIEVQSTEGEGTTVRIVLPLRSSDESQNCSLEPITAGAAMSAAASVPAGLVRR